MGRCLIRVVSYGAVSAAGRTASEFWSHLINGIVPSSLPQEGDFPLVKNLLIAWNEAKRGLNCELEDEDLGVILASTKGAVEDFVWSKSFLEMDQDPISQVLEEFLQSAGIRPKLDVCVSNACASTHSALWLAQNWMKQKRVRNVIILAVDQIGPFVLKGFQTLKLLSSRSIRPFSFDRDGLRLGSAAAVLVLSTSIDQGPELLGLGLASDGSTLTRPSESGRALRKACLEVLPHPHATPDVIVAHGTGTFLNDRTEDETFFELFRGATVKPLVTATKWCIGHTMGASGAMDLIAACRMLGSQEVFRMATTTTVDPSFRNRYATASSSIEKVRMRDALVSSLGFGGVHSAAWLRSVDRP